ncbi:tetratricopeptide repeat protein [Ekhidna sp. To15]|uniref:tetratricopeptide repeat protein n=1 Tax=Ekhidna sp. To15 TaxID=3395267 RepID=UPI003F51C9CF
MIKNLKAIYLLVSLAISPLLAIGMTTSDTTKLAICNFSDLNNEGLNRFQYYVGVGFLGLNNYEIIYDSDACKNSSKEKQSSNLKTSFDFILSGNYSTYGGELYISASLYHVDTRKYYTVPAVFDSIGNSYAVFEQLGIEVRKKISDVKNELSGNNGILIYCTSNEVSKDPTLNNYFADITRKTTEKLQAPNGLRIVNSQESKNYYFSSLSPSKIAKRANVSSVIMLEMALNDNYDVVVKPHFFHNDLEGSIDLISIESEYDEEVFNATLTGELNSFVDQIYPAENTWNYQPMLANFDSFYDYVEKGANLRSRGEYYFSKYFFEKALKLDNLNDSQEAELYDHIGYINYKTNRYDQAIDDLNMSLKKLPGELYATYLLGHVYNDIGESEQAVSYFMKAEEIQPNYKNTSLFLGYNFYALQNYDSAIIYFRKTLNTGNRTPVDKKEAIKYLGYSFHNTLSYDSADKYYKMLLKLEPANSSVKYNLSKTHTIRGIDFYFDDKFNRALQEFEIAKSFDAQNATIYDYLRLCYNGLFRFSNSRQLIEKGLEDGVFDEDIYFNQAEDLAVQIYDNKVPANKLEAIANEIYFQLDRDIELHPQRSAAYFRYGNILTYFGHPDESIGYLEKALEYDPSNLSSRLDLTEAYIIGNQPSKTLDVNDSYDYEQLKLDSNEFDLDRNHTLLLFYTIVAKIILDQKYDVELKGFENLLTRGTSINSWTFDPFERWISTASLSQEKTKEIKRLTKRIKEFQ